MTTFQSWLAFYGTPGILKRYFLKERMTWSDSALISQLNCPCNFLVKCYVLLKISFLYFNVFKRSFTVVLMVIN